MLKVLHNHIFAGRLQELVASSSLLLVYQNLGDMRVADIAGAMQEALNKQLPKAGITPQVCRMRNSVAASTGDPTVCALFHSSNVLVGFLTPEQRAAQQVTVTGASEMLLQQQQADRRGGGSAVSASPDDAMPSSNAAGAAPGLRFHASRRSTLPELVGGLLGEASPPFTASSSGRISGSGIPAQQAALDPAVERSLVEMALRLPAQQPLLLLGAFYRRRPLQLRHLSEWTQLDPSQVFPQLLSTIEGPLEGLLECEGLLDDVGAVLHQAHGLDAVLQALEQNQSTSGTQLEAGGSGDVQAGPPPP